MKTFRYAVAGGVMLATVVAACSDQMMGTDPNMAARKATTQGSKLDEYELAATAGIVITGRDANGKVVSVETEADITGSGDSKRGMDVPKVKMHGVNAKPAPNSDAWSEPVRFGAALKHTTVDGKSKFSFNIRGTKLTSTTVDGKLVEVFVVRKGGGKTGEPIGLVTTIDGHTTQYLEGDFANKSKTPASVRIVNVDRNLRVTSEMRMSVGNMKRLEKLADGTTVGARKWLGRLMRGAEALVLPDKLAAMELRPDHPCKGTEQNMVTAGITYASLALAAAVADGFCAGLFFTCPAALAANIAAGAALLVSLYWVHEYNFCLSWNSEHCGEFQDNPCGVDPGGSGTPNFDGQAGSSGDNPGNTNWGSSYADTDIACDWWENSYYNPVDATWYTVAQLNCHYI